MKRQELEHILRAASAITNTDRLLVIGSQAILFCIGRDVDLPSVVTYSEEADIAPLDGDEKVIDLIDGLIGEGSMFQDSFGYYAQGVEPKTAILPDGWKDRLVAVKNENMGGCTGLFLEIHDLLVSKYCAGRPKDREYCKAIAQTGFASGKTLLGRLDKTEAHEKVLEMARHAILSDYPSMSQDCDSDLGPK